MNTGSRLRRLFGGRGHTRPGPGTDRVRNEPAGHGPAEETRQVRDPDQVPSRGRLEDVSSRRRGADQQVAALQAFEARLEEQVRKARASGQPDATREILERHRAVLARLEEATFRRESLRHQEEQLEAEL